MFDRPPGFLLSKKQCIQNMTMDNLKIAQPEKKMTEVERKEWGARRVARAKIIEKLGDYESHECPGWKGEIPHNFMRNMREAMSFDSLARTPFKLQGQKNQVWTVMETSSSRQRKVIRFYTVRNSREIPFTLVLEKAMSPADTYQIIVQTGAKFTNQDKLGSDIKQFFASPRHLYDLITNDIWPYMDTLPPLATKHEKVDSSRNVANSFQPPAGIQIAHAEAQKSLSSQNNAREVHNPRDQNMRRNTDNMMQNRRNDQGSSRGGMAPRGGYNSRVYNNYRDVNYNNSASRSSYGANKENSDWRLRNSSSSTHMTTQDARKGHGYRGNTNFSSHTNSVNTENSIWPRKNSYKEVQNSAPNPQNTTNSTPPVQIDAPKKEHIPSSHDTTKTESPKDVTVVNNEKPQEVTTNSKTESSENAANKENSITSASMRGAKKMIGTRGGSFNARNTNYLKNRPGQ